MTMKWNNPGRSWGCIVAFAIGIIVLSGGRLCAEYVFLKNGTVIECKILNESPSAMTVLTDKGKTIMVNRATVLRVMYTQLYRGRLYIQKTNGKVIEAYIIDEDQENYTVRPELNSPMEFSIRRDDVLFMTRKNPSALEGRVSYKHVDLSWRGPYTPDNPVKHFKIYIRTKAGEYNAAGETTGTGYRAKGLQCNTEYYAIVTAVDKSGYESLPSNVVHFTTRKGKPVPPDNIRMISVISDAAGMCTANLSWDSAVDPCGGAISEYGVYLKDESAKEAEAGDTPGNRFPGYRLTGKTSGNSLKIPGLKDRTRYRVRVTSIDNTKDESGAGWSVAFNTENMMPDYPFPVTCQKIVSKDKTGPVVKLSWDKADDPDGSVANYRVYRKVKSTYVLLGATDKTEFEAKGISLSEKHYFVVRSVDNRSGESADSYPASTGLVRYVDIAAKGASIVPIGKYSRLYNPGYGGTFSVSAENLFLDRMAVGVETGYFHFKGKTDTSREAALVPFMVSMAYRIHLARWVSIDPAAAFGGCYTMAWINTANLVPADLMFVSRYTPWSAIELIFSAGVNCTFTISKLAIMQIGATYYGIAERGGLLSFFSVNAGAGVRI